jgi:hypothetical protein
MVLFCFFWFSYVFVIFVNFFVILLPPPPPPPPPGGGAGGAWGRGGQTRLTELAGLSSS